MMRMMLGGLLMAASASASAVGNAGQVVNHMQELNLEQVSNSLLGPQISLAPPPPPPARARPLPDLRCRFTGAGQLEALYALLDDDGSGSLTVHEMIDLFVSIRNAPSAIETTAAIVT